MLFDKIKTLELKGIAILMMLYLHLFNTEYKTSLCDWNFHVLPDVSFLRMLTRLANPVPFFIMLSGYGLFCKFMMGRERGFNFRRIWKLLINYWVILFLFVAIGCWVNPTTYPGDLKTFILNFFALSYSYNGEWWFLFPYIVLSLISPFLFEILEKYTKWTVALSFFVFVCYLLINRFVAISGGLVSLFVVASLQFPFILGALLCKMRMRDNLGLQIFLLVVVCLIRLYTDVGASFLNLLYALLFIMIYVKLTIPISISKVFVFLGKHSTNMWFVHSFFIFYLFGPVIYQLRNPLVIYVALVFGSLFISLLLHPIIKMIYVKLKI